MVYIPTTKLPNNDFWLSFYLEKNSDFFSHVKTKKIYIKDTEFEVKITFGSLYCHKETEVFIDSNTSNSYQINGLIIKDKENTIIDLSCNQYKKNEETNLMYTKHIQGKVIRFSTDRYIEFLGISFYNESLNDIPTLTIKNKREITQKLSRIFDLFFTNPKIKYSQIYFRSRNLYKTVLQSSTLYTDNLAIQKNTADGNLNQYEKIIDQALSMNIFKYQDLLKEFDIHERKANKYFQTHREQSLYQYFLTRKIDFGYILITKSKTQISEVAKLMGYKNHQTLANQIRRIYGRNSLKNKEIQF